MSQQLAPLPTRPTFTTLPTVKQMSEYIQALLESVQFYEPAAYKALFPDDEDFDNPAPEQKRRDEIFEEIRLAINICREHFTERQQGLVRGKCHLNKMSWFFFGKKGPTLPGYDADEVGRDGK